MKEHDAGAILAAFVEAVADLLQDSDLVKAKPEEISITTELAIKMLPYFRGWRVSPEWTRRDDEEKRLAWDDEEGKRQLKKIRPDILVHRMHQQDENLLVVEVKRVQNNDFKDDIRKLTLMTLEESVDPDYHYGYVVGLHLVIDLPARVITRGDVYRRGAIDEALTSEFLKLLDTVIRDRSVAA